MKITVELDPTSKALCGLPWDDLTTSEILTLARVMHRAARVPQYLLEVSAAAALAWPGEL